MRIPELLAPVGSMEHLKVAINSGASSVYLSGKDYGARKYAENFTLDEINEAVNMAHMHNVKVYVTVNTLIKQDELEEVINYLSNLYSIGVDAVLVQDLGLIELINRYLPNLKIHASTQMTLENQQKLKYIENKGIKRVVLPREMTKEEIAALDTNLELEIFAHGSLCYSYSGQCLMSSFKGGRSGNRGTCAQPCRQKYQIKGINKKDYYLSPCDLNLLNQLKEIGIQPLDYPRLIRLNPFARYKTRGNGALSFVVELNSRDEVDTVEKIVLENVEKYSMFDGVNTNPGVVFYEGEITQKMRDYAINAIYKIYTIVQYIHVNKKEEIL